MNEILKDLTIEFDQSYSDAMIQEWRWLLGNNKSPIIISAVGDMFLKDSESNGIYWLNVGSGECCLVASGMEEFEERLKDIDQVNEWFMIDLATKLRSSEIELKDGQLYSYKKMPILGGEYSVDNFMSSSIVGHFSFSGLIHQQIKDLPDGTNIEIKVVD